MIKTLINMKTLLHNYFNNYNNKHKNKLKKIK